MSSNSGPGYAKHPNHKLKLSPADERWQVLIEGHTVASSTRCLRLDEGSYPPVYYFPKSDVDAALLSPSDTETYCPFKGTASYWNVTVTDANTGAQKVVEDVLWGYPQPYDEMLEMADYVAFYPQKVDSISPAP